MTTMHFPRAWRGKALLLVAWMLACDSSSTAPVNPESQAGALEIGVSATAIPQQGDIQATATVRNRAGEEMSGREVRWGTYTPSVVTVDSVGKTVHIRGLSPGTGRVWAASSGLKEEVTITVTGSAERVEVTPATSTMPLGTSLQFQALVHDAAGNLLPNPAVAWSTSSVAQLSVTQTGVVTAAGVGVAQVTATINGRSGSAQVTITPTAVATVLVAPNPAEATLGRAIQFFPTLKDASGNLLTGRDVAWSSSNPAVLAIGASGLGEAKTLGNAVVTATSEGKSGTTQVSVVPQGSLVITVSPPSASINPGETKQFTATARNSTGAEVTGLPVSWASSDPSVATISSAGMATGMGPGVTTITAIVDGRSGNTSLSVRSPAPVLSGVSPDSMTAGRPSDLVITVTGAGFTRETRVRWNGTDRPTEYLSATRLLATITAADLEEPRTAPVTVYTPPPGGGVSTPYPFQVKSRYTRIVGDTVSDELRPPGDADDFRFDGQAGQEINVYFQSLSGNSSQTLRLELYGPSSTYPIEAVASDGADQTLKGQGMGPIRLPATGTYTIRVEGYYGTEQGPYRFFVMPIATAPERIGRAITAGPVITGEDIAPVGDIDEFTFTGSKGQLVNVFFQATSGAASDDLYLYLLSPNRESLASLRSEGSDRTLEGQAMGRFELPLTGTYTVRIRGANPREDEGTYRFQVVPLSRSPESLPSQFTLGAVVAGESISPQGDVDEFSFTASAQQEINVFFQAQSGDPADFRLWLLSSDGSTVGSISSTGTDATLERQGFGPIVISRAGTYRIVVAGYYGTETGAYRFQVAPINLAPEHVNAAVTPGPIVSGEDISPVGDVDQFTFTATRGQAINVFFQAKSGLSSDALRLSIIDPAGRLVQSVFSDGNDLSLEGQQSGRLVLSQDGTYIVRVRPESWGSRGPYEFRVAPLQ